jgi:peptidoglycan/xylan/chitin deacetylase (PgdA/CDA1 family)
MKSFLRFLLAVTAITALAADRPIGVIEGDTLARLSLRRDQLREPLAHATVQFIRKTQYLNNSRAVITHTMDDSEKRVLQAVDLMDKYGIKATLFVSTRTGDIEQMWPRLRQAIGNGHEIGSHSRTHQCKWPETAAFCAKAFSDSEVMGSRDDILKNTGQPYVWAWCYPCGLCAANQAVHEELARAGYLVARNYPDESHDGHVIPNLQTYAVDPYNAAYTQVVQKIGGIAKRGNTDVTELNAKFDEVYRHGGIYSFMSHSQWLDFGPDDFYQRHLAYLARRRDVWYVPMGLLYAYKTVLDRTEVRALDAPAGAARFAIFNDLDPKIYRNSLTLQFIAPANAHVLAGGKPLTERQAGLTDRWSEEYFRREGGTVYVTLRPNTILEFRR